MSILLLSLSGTIVFFLVEKKERLIGLCQNVAAWLTGAPQGCVSGPPSFFSLYTKWVKSSLTNHIIKSSGSILVPAENEKWSFLTAAERSEGLKRKKKTPCPCWPAGASALVAATALCVLRCLSCECWNGAPGSQWTRGLAVHRRRSKVVNSIYCKLRRSDSHPECNLARRRSDLHALHVRFKSFNYSAACWRFKFGLFILFCLQ